MPLEELGRHWTDAVSRNAQIAQGFHHASHDQAPDKVAELQTEFHQTFVDLLDWQSSRPEALGFSRQTEIVDSYQAVEAAEQHGNEVQADIDEKVASSEFHWFVKRVLSLCKFAPFLLLSTTSCGNFNGAVDDRSDRYCSERKTCRCKSANAFCTLMSDQSGLTVLRVVGYLAPSVSIRLSASWQK